MRGRHPFESGPKHGAKEAQAMQITLPDNAVEDAVGQGLRATIMAGAVKYLVEQLTPERMEKFINELIDKSLGDLNSWQITRELDKVMGPIMAEYSRRPDVIARVEASVKDGMERVMKDLPMLIESEFRQVIVDAIVDRYRRSR